MRMKYREVNNISSLKKNILFNLLLFLGALNLNIILRPLKIAAGGINGLSIVVENIFKINPSFFILFFQLFIFLLSLFFLPRDKSFSALYAIIAYPFFVSITSFFSKLIVVSSEHIIVASIFGGIITGIVSGYICKIGKSPGGIILLSQILFDKYKISISLSNFIINTFILLITFYNFGMNYFLYSLLLLYCNRKIMDKIIIY